MDTQDIRGWKGLAFSFTDVFLLTYEAISIDAKYKVLSGSSFEKVVLKDIFLIIIFYIKYKNNIIEVKFL